MKVYAILYDYSLGGNIIDIFLDKIKADNEVKRLNGNSLRNGTYSVVEKEIK